MSKTIKIHEDKCVGCGMCVNSCPGGALEMVEGKAKLVRADHCDGLGACIGECPVDAIEFIDREEAPKVEPAHEHHHHPGGGCPSKANKVFAENTDKPQASASALQAWPIQLHLIRPEAEQFQGADVLIAASCTAFSCGGFHANLLQGKALIIACPKLDNLEGYAQKLEQIFSTAKPKSVTVARMEVPCCSGLSNLVKTAQQSVDSDIPVQEITIGLQGDILNAKIL